MFCSRCGKPVQVQATFCGACGNPVRPGVAAPPDAALRMLLPIGRSGWAIAAGYLGLFSPIAIFAPFAVVCGILALRDLEKHPEKVGRGRAWFGIIAGALFTLLLVAFLIARTAQ